MKMGVKLYDMVSRKYRLDDTITCDEFDVDLPSAVCVCGMTV